MARVPEGAYVAARGRGSECASEGQMSSRHAVCTSCPGKFFEIFDALRWLLRPKTSLEAFALVLAR